MVTGEVTGLWVDIRTRAGDAKTSIVIPNEKEMRPRALGENGQISLPVEEDQDGNAACVVVLNAVGTVLAKQTTTVGE